MFTKIEDWWRARNVEVNRRELIQCEPKSTFRASLASLAPHSDLRRWKRWADRCPPHLQELPKDIPDDVPYMGDPDTVPDLNDNIPHVAQAMSGA